MKSKTARLPKLIGVIHLPALPGAPLAFGVPSESVLQQAGFQAVQEAVLLEKAGFDGVILENFGDQPFFKERVPAETIAAMSVIAAAVREASSLVLGINVLRNDARAALAIASVVGAEFIRVNVLSGVVATDQGLIEGQAADVLRTREALGGQVQIFADAHVKHAKTLSSERIEVAIDDLTHRAMASAIIVTGEGTGKKVDPDHLERAAAGARAAGVPLFVGSGSTIEDLPMLARHVDGVIVGSALRKSGKAGMPLELKRVKAFALAFKKAFKGGKVSKKEAPKKAKKVSKKA